MLSFILMQSTHRYFPVNDAQRAWGLYATCAGHSKTEARDTFPSPQHPDEYYFTWEQGRILHEWQLILLERGRGTVEFRHRQYSVKTGTLIVLPPECWHRYRPSKTTGWSTIWIGFDGDLAARLIGAAKVNHKGEVRDMSNAHHFRRIMSNAVTDVLERGQDNIFSIAARIPMIVAALIEAHNADAAGASHAGIIHHAQSHIAAHAAELVDFEALSESLGIPYRTFRHMFAKETGTSPLQYQLDIRLARAKNLLRSTRMPISEIATTLGFKTNWYFAHFFRRRTKTSPAAYRMRYHGDRGISLKGKMV